MPLVPISKFSRLLAKPVRPPSLAVLWIAGTILFQLLYTAIFAAFWDHRSIAGAALLAFTNVLPLALLAAAARAILKTYVMPLGVIAQGAAHLASAPLFAVIWYGAVVVIQSILQAGDWEDVWLRNFNVVALAWQAFQGLVIYALIAAICYAVRGGRQAVPVSFIEAPPALERYLVRTGDEFVPIVVGNIVLITGAQDYSEVMTTDRRNHLVRMSLGEFERRLDAHQFVRVHRSTIINLDHLERVEPAGNGRMTAHLSDGQSVEVSRTGTQVLRRFVV